MNAETESHDAGPTSEVWTLMTRAVARISPDARLDEAARKLAAIDAGALAVGTTESVVGVISERDVTRAFGRSDDPSSMLVGDVASTDLLWCEPTVTAFEAAQTMCANGARHLLVGHGDRHDLKGIISARDLIEALVAG